MSLTFPIPHLVLPGVFAAGLLLVGCDLPKSVSASKAAPAAPAEMPPPEVAVATVQPERLVLTSELSGRISANLVAEVRPQVGGILQQRLFAEGSDVKAGDILYQIDPAMYQAACASAQAALAKAEANLTPVRLKAERYRELVKSKAVSQQDYDEAEAAFKLAEADLALAKATASIADINLAYTQVRAPISGRIGKSSVTTGALVTANQATPLTVIQNLDSVFVDVTVSNARLLQRQRDIENGLMKSSGVGQVAVKLLLEDGSAYPQPGVLKFSDVTVDPGTGSVTLRTVFPNPEHQLLPGMYVHTLVDDGVMEAAILVPQQAVSRDARGNPYALVVDAADHVEQRPLKISRNLGDRWLVAEGLKAGERVVMEGSQRIRPGVAVVKPIPFVRAAVPAFSSTSAATH